MPLVRRAAGYPHEHRLCRTAIPAPSQPAATAAVDKGPQAERFDLLMALQGKDEVRALALYLEKAWDLRSRYFALQASPQALQDRFRSDSSVCSDSVHNSDYVSERPNGASAVVHGIGIKCSREDNIERPRLVASSSGSDSEIVLEP